MCKLRSCCERRRAERYKECLQDWVTQVTIGLFMAKFVYICLVFLVPHPDSQSTFIPQVSLITSWVLVVVSFGFLVYYSQSCEVDPKS